MWCVYMPTNVHDVRIKCHADELMCMIWCVMSHTFEHTGYQQLHGCMHNVLTTKTAWPLLPCCWGYSLGLFFSRIPSGNPLQRTMERSHHFQWTHPQFRLGHGFHSCVKLPDCKLYPHLGGSNFHCNESSQFSESFPKKDWISRGLDDLSSVSWFTWGYAWQPRDHRLQFWSPKLWWSLLNSGRSHRGIVAFARNQRYEVS